MRRLFIALNCVVLAVASVVLIPAFALADVPSSYTSYGYATGVHGIAGSDAFPNFQNGAVNNRYPMAEVLQDASPSSTAKATYSDSGPAVATVGSSYNQGCSQSGSQPPPPQICQNPNNQVPYANATYPGPSHGHIDQCNGCGNGPYADANAGQMNADASGYYAGGGTQPFSGASGKTNTVMDSGGTLTVTPSVKDGTVELTFQDSGCGMTADILENIFEPFFTRSRTGKGTGLGLSISHRIISSHGGDITAASAGPGQGSTFTVRLPIEQPAELRDSAIIREAYLGV